jgi:hypothetical protein
LGFRNDARVLLGEECHPDPNLFLVIPDDGVEERKQFLDFLRFLLAGYFGAELTHDIDAVHKPSPSETLLSGLVEGKYSDRCME